jgi:hypothetical protein
MNLKVTIESRARIAIFHSTFDCRVIFINEMALNELDCQSRLADTLTKLSKRWTRLYDRISLTTTAYDYELILPQKLCLYFVG